MAATEQIPAAERYPPATTGFTGGDPRHACTNLRVCLVGATHPCHNPRLVREADSLAEAGHEVRVVAPAALLELSEKDERMLRTRRWRLQVVDYSPVGRAGLFRSWNVRLQRRLSAEMYRVTSAKAFAERAYVPSLTRIKQLAASEPADWFIAHAHAALPIAGSAAKSWQARLGFDCEDLLAHGQSDAAKIALLIEKTYLAQCDYVSVPSKGVAADLLKTHGKLNSVVLYNFFPTARLGSTPPPCQRKQSDVIKLYWFSQTIGSGRGIEDALAAAAILGNGVELHLRGKWASGYEEKIRNTAQRLKVSLHSHPVIDPDLLLEQMSEFDVGLALEPLSNHNAALTQSNKIGSYFLAGLAIAASDTPGQREVLGQESQAGFLYPSGRAELLAAGLKKWRDNRESLRASQQAAWDIARERYCWDVEQEKFFKVLGLSPNGAGLLQQA